MNLFRDYRARAAAVAVGGLVVLFAVLPARAGGPIETSIFAVQGVDVDETSTDATSAKNQALLDVQVKAFYILVERLGSEALAEDLRQRLRPEDIVPYLRSLSIEQESSAPGRYIGRFTVRFLPDKMQAFFQRYGFRVPTQQAEPILVIPVYRAPDGPKLWEDNAWRQAWIGLNGEQGMVPIIVPLGDLEDTETLAVNDALKGDAIHLEAIRKRYGAPSLLVAQAEPMKEGGLHVYITGDTKLGKVTVNKIYKAEEGVSGSVEAIAAQAFQRMVFKTYRDQATSQVAVAEAPQPATGGQSLAVSVPFSSPREWNAIRSRILTAPNVTGVDLSSLSTDGAVIKLMFSSSLEELQGNMQAAGLRLSQSGEAWVIQPM